MIFELRYAVEAETVQKATALRDKAAEQMAEDPDVTVISASSARLTQDYRVVGVDTKTKEPFIEVVDATDEDDAAAQAIGASKTRLVAEAQAFRL